MHASFGMHAYCSSAMICACEHMPIKTKLHALPATNYSPCCNHQRDSLMACCAQAGSRVGCRELAKAVQNELAEANTVAEESLSSMATVRSHAAEDSARAAYQHRLHLFYRLCVRPSPLLLLERH